MYVSVYVLHTHMCVCMHAVYAHRMGMKDDCAPSRILHSTDVSPVFIDP